MAKNLSKQGGIFFQTSGFSKDSIRKFELDNPALFEAIKNWKITEDSSDLFEEFCSMSLENRVVALLHIVKYSPDDHDDSLTTKTALEDCIGTLFDRGKFTGGIVGRNEIIDNVLDFLYDNKEVHSHFLKIAKSWEEVDNVCAHVMKSDYEPRFD